MSGAREFVDRTLDAYLRSRGLAGAAYHQDPSYRAHVEWLRGVLAALHTAMEDEGVHPAARDRIVHRVLYEAGPGEQDAAARLAERERRLASILLSTTAVDVQQSRGADVMTMEPVHVRVLLLVGDMAEIVADVPPEERAAPERYRAADIAVAVGVPLDRLPGKQLSAEVGRDGRLSGWKLR
ncbi:hypothetical protein ACIQPQ_34445 [Streptomyces sp. NPDC091281]|uniref:hypothetical protein n=1 Tax=Streptomyces sp. NPDC091281 TaxID=3365985 RepID=UPI00382F502A